VTEEPLRAALVRVVFGVCGVAGLMIAFRVLMAQLPAAQIPGLTWPRALALAATFAMMGGALALVRKAVTGRGRPIETVRRTARRSTATGAPHLRSTTHGRSRG
jgi:predicted lysophospholipase L1 biosynthesis ABC-type transport system permease subunit